MDKTQLKALCEPTRMKILGFLAECPLTNTELYEKLKQQDVVYRESIFKALKKLMAAGLIKRSYFEKIGYKYSLNFKQLKINERLIISKK